MSIAVENQTQVHEAIELLQQLADLFNERREQLARDAGLTVQQWKVLEQISDEHFMPSLFARECESTAAAVSKTIRQLLDKGVITVAVSKDDGRCRQYSLTKAGRTVLGQLRNSRKAAIEAVWGKFDPGDLGGFVEFGKNLATSLKAYSQRQERAGKGRNG